MCLQRQQHPRKIHTHTMNRNTHIYSKYTLQSYMHYTLYINASQHILNKQYGANNTIASSFYFFHFSSCSNVCNAEYTICICILQSITTSHGILVPNCFYSSLTTFHLREYAGTPTQMLTVHSPQIRNIYANTFTKCNQLFVNEMSATQQNYMKIQKE